MSSRRRPRPPQAPSPAAAARPSPRPPSVGDAWLSRAPLLVVPLVAAACYLNALGAPFVVDDLGAITGATAQGDLAGLLRAALAPGADAIFKNRVVGYLSFALGTALHGPRPAPLRAGNVLLHALNALLVGRLALSALRGAASDGSDRLRPARVAALLAALLFAAHPLATSAVTYLVQRLAVMATTFYLGAMALHAGARSRRSLGAAVALEAAAFLSGFLAMHTKEIAFTLPVALALFDLLFLPRPRGGRLAWLAPQLALLAVLPASMLSAPGGSLAAATAMLPSAPAPVTRWGYLVSEQTVLLRYLRLAVAPFGQRFFWPVPLRAPLDAPAALAAALHLALLGGAAALVLWARAAGREALRLAGFGIVFFYVAASVESSVIPIQDLMFEHRAYLPLAGLTLSAAGLGLWAAERFALGRALAAAGAAGVLALGAGTVVRHRAWRSYGALMADSAAKSPESARVRFWYGMALKSEGDLRGAAQKWQEALALDACHVPSLNALGSLHFAAGDAAGALALFDRANACEPGEPTAWQNGGAALDRLGRRAEARLRYERFLSLAPAGVAGAPAAPVRARLGQRD